MKRSDRSYLSYRRHYQEYAKRHAMETELLSKKGYLNLVDTYKKEHHSLKNIPRDIAKSQQAISYKEALRIKSKVDDKMSLREIQTYNDEKYIIDGKSYSGNIKQSMYFYLLNKFGVSVADESFGY